MRGAGSILFTDVRDFEARLPGAVHFVLADAAPFGARLTWMELRDLRLVHARETIRRVGYHSLPTGRVFVFFPIDRRSALVCDGTEIKAGEIVLYRDGARTHQRTSGATAWSSISLETATLRKLGVSLAGCDFTDALGMFFRTVPADWKQFLKSHSEAIRIAETRLSHIDRPQVVRALEQELIWALVNCLSNAEAIGHMAGDDQSDVLARFETCLAKHAVSLPISAICECIHVSERTLRSLCSHVLGMSPARYVRLRHAPARDPQRESRIR